jgi:hypothetical protein
VKSDLEDFHETHPRRAAAVAAGRSCKLPTLTSDIPQGFQTMTSSNFTRAISPAPLELHWR